MTVHWNSHRGFVEGPKTASSAVEPSPESGAAELAELQLAARKCPDVRAAQISRGRKLLADPNYPSREVLKKVAAQLARHWTERVNG